MKGCAPTGVCPTVNRIPVLPTLLTLANGVCGFAAIAYASKISLDADHADGAGYYFIPRAPLVFVAMVFDVLDGYAARLSRSTSEFGGQLDSLCDAISFGAAPAFLLLRLGQEWQGNILIAKTIATHAPGSKAPAVPPPAAIKNGNNPLPAAAKRFHGPASPSPAAGLGA